MENQLSSICYNINMPANLPPQFHSVSAKLKEAKTPQEKISILEELLAICPKHKGTEKIRKELKTKIAKLRKKGPKKKKAKTLYFVQKEGAGQLVILGPANSGKSSLLNALTKAQAKVSAFPFTTQLPKPGMMKYQNIQIQLIDTPPLTKKSPPWLKETLKASDALLAVFDLAKENVLEDIREFKEILKDWQLSDKKILLLGNKIDLAKSQENLKKIESQYRIKPISCQKGLGIEKLKEEIFNLLEIIRVYTKSPQKPPDFSRPFTIKKNSRLIDLAKEIHQDFLFSFKYAKLFKSSFKKPKIVGKDYILKDGDIIEIHI